MSCSMLVFFDNHVQAALVIRGFAIRGFDFRGYFLVPKNLISTAFLWIFRGFID